MVRADAHYHVLPDLPILRFGMRSPFHPPSIVADVDSHSQGLVISLLTVDTPGSVVRNLNPSLRVKGLTFGRWRLRGDDVELWGLEDPSVEESRRKYSFRMSCRLKSSTRGRM